jgi:hypothetical protein
MRRPSGPVGHGATDVVLSQTDLTTVADRQRTWQVVGELNRVRTA